MTRIMMRYGEFAGSTLAEIPAEHLQELATRYPLESERYDPSDARSLLIVVAIHEEIRRRGSGGTRKTRIPSLRELANQLVSKGYHQLSKVHHPDRDGTSEAQRRLNQAKEQLLQSCLEIADDSEDAIVIEAAAEVGPEISDEDIPF
jgi:hypothetical protein